MRALLHAALFALVVAAVGCASKGKLVPNLDAGDIGDAANTGSVDLSPPLDAGGAGAPDLSPPLAPTWSTEFTAGEQGLWTQSVHGGTLTFGAPDSHAGDNAVVALRFPGDPNLGPGDHASPAWATEIDSKRQFQYGTFRARVQLAACKSAEDVVNGYFTYFNDGTDHNGNGIIDNSEIDIEILCGTPFMISLTSWTDYDEASGKFLKWSRAIDTRTGNYSESVAADSYDQAPKGNSADFVIPGFPDPNAYYEMGFTWTATNIRFFLVAGGKEITLWDNIDPKYVPQLSSQLMFNVWHPTTHWFGGGGSANYPASDATMRIDWARYWAP